MTTGDDLCDSVPMAQTNAADGTRIVYSDSGGSGSAVVLVHGITERAESWRPVIDRLAGDHRVIALDLRGHGASDTAPRYDLEAMAGDVIAVASACGLDRPHLVGHSLGGAVVSAVGAGHPVASVVNVDQSLQLGSFKAGLVPVEALLRDPMAFQTVIDSLFDQMSGPLLSDAERARIGALRRAEQAVVLGVWEMMFTMTDTEIASVVDGALAGYAGRTVPYLSLFGIDPGEGYAEWLSAKIDGARVEVWDDHGHYPHLVDPDRFVDRLESFWT